MSKGAERRVSVELNLEESGWLCHLLMLKIGPYILGRRTSADSYRPILQRQIELYERLASANDELRGSA